MTDTLIVLRVASGQWLNPDKTEKLLAWLGSRPGAVDEIALFSSFTHPPLPIDTVRQYGARLAEVMLQIRAEGYRVGVNILATMGHREENLPGSLAEPWPRVTDPAGKVSLGSYCPASPSLLGYAEELYELVAKAQPDFIWVDDDVRLMSHQPVQATCFCDQCIERFNREIGADYTRASLVAAMSGAPSAQRDELRLLWLEHNRRMIADLLRRSAQAVHRVDPQLSLGFMTGDRFYEGYGFREWAEALEGPESPPARWRPGCGFYTDDAYLGLVDKANAIGRQVSQLPARVTVIQSEIESFTYQRLSKSVAVTMLEGIAYMAAGATGLALNVIGDPDELDEQYTPLLDGVFRIRPFLQALREASGRSACEGLWPAWNRNLYADRRAEGDWLERNQNMEALGLAYVLGEIGLPMAYDPQGARASLMAGPIPGAFAAEELRELFKGGVVLDGEALMTLEGMGLVDWTGVRLARTIDIDAIEILAEHPLNGSFGGWRRNCRQSFWPQPSYHLEPLKPDVEVLANMVDYQGNVLGPCMTAYENPMGGRVVVLGYSPWQRIYDLAKSNQLKAVCRWVSRDTLPVVVETYAKVVIWARRSAQGGLTAVLINASLDPIPELFLRARTRVTELTRWLASGEQDSLSAQRVGPEHVRVRMTDIAPWSAHLLCWPN